MFVYLCRAKNESKLALTSLLEKTFYIVYVTGKNIAANYQYNIYTFVRYTQ